MTRRDGSRPEAPSIDRRCAALAPTSRPAIAHLSSPGFPQRIAPWGFLGARPHGGCNQRASGFLGSSSPLAPHGTSGRRIVRLRTWRAPSSDATFTHDCTSSGQAPVHRDPRAPLRAFAFGGRASLGRSRLSTSATRLQRTGTSTCVASAPASKPRASCEVECSPGVCPTFALEEHAAGSAPRKHDPKRIRQGPPASCDASRGAATDRTAWSEGPAAFWAFCGLASSEAGRTSLCHQPAAPGAWSAPVAPHVVHRARFPGVRGAALGFTR